MILVKMFQKMIKLIQEDRIINKNLIDKKKIL